MILTELYATVVMGVRVVSAANEPGATDSAGVEQMSLQDAAVWRLLYNGGEQVDQEMPLHPVISGKRVKCSVKQAGHVCVPVDMTQLLAGELGQEQQNILLLGGHSQCSSHPAAQEW